MVDKEKTPEEILTEEKQVLFSADIEESKARQRLLIANAGSAIDYANGQVTIQEGRKAQARKLLDELEARYPTAEPEV